MKLTELVSPRLPPALLNSVRTSAVAVVGQRLDDDGDAAGAVTLVAHLVIGGVVLAARAALDGPFHGIARHIRLARRDDRRAQPRIGGGIGLAGLRRNR